MFVKEMGEDFGFGMYCVEVDYFIDCEWVYIIEDVLW